LTMPPCPLYTDLDATALSILSRARGVLIALVDNTYSTSGTGFQSQVQSGGAAARIGNGKARYSSDQNYRHDQSPDRHLTSAQTMTAKYVHSQARAHANLPVLDRNQPKRTPVAAATTGPLCQDPAHRADIILKANAIKTLSMAVGPA
jgi:hypothetical protein